MEASFRLNDQLCDGGIARVNFDPAHAPGGLRHGALACHLIPVPPDMVARTWPHVREYLERACKRGGGLSFAELEASIRAGERMLWIVSDDRAIYATLATELHEVEEGKVCVIVALGGAGMRKWLWLIDGIESYAKSQGCNIVRVIGRNGWERMLPRYKRTRVVLDKRLI